MLCKVIKVLLGLILFLNGLSVSAKPNFIEIGELIHPENDLNIEDSDFIFLDFWATWCGPCIKVMTHLETLKSGCSKDIKFLSISNEPSAIVRKFFEGKNQKGIIAVDFKGKTFENFSVQAIPHAEIIAPDGKVIWKGNPNTLDVEQIRYLTSKKYKIIPLSQKLKVHTVVEENVPKQFDIPLNGADYKAFFYPSNTEVSFNKLTSDEKILISGNVKSILAELTSLLDDNIFLKPDSLFYGTLEIFPKVNEPQLKAIFFTLCQKLNYTIRTDTAIAEVFYLKEENSDNFWGNEVYQWSEDNSSNYLIDEFSAQFDNFTLHEVCKILSRILDRKIMYNGADTTIRDWNLVIDSFENLRQQLLDEYGIEITSENISVPEYHLYKN